MYDLLFAPAWYFLLAGGLVGVGLVLHGLRRGLPGPRMAGAVVLIVTVLWLIMDGVVQTPTEAAESGTKQFVKAVVARDAIVIGRYLSPTASIGESGRVDMEKLLPRYADDWGLKSATITDTILEERGSEVLANIHVFSQHDTAKLHGLDTFPSDWQFVWAKEGGGWHITQITPIKLGSSDPHEILREFFKH